MSGNEIVLDLSHGPNNPRNSEGAFATLTDGRILYAYSRYSGEKSGDEAPAVIAARTSADGGLTWSDDRTLVEREGRCNVMSVSLLRLHDGRLAMWYLRKDSFMSCIPYMRTSTDDGETWSESVRCIPAPGYFVVNNDRVIQLESGRLLIPAALHRAKIETQEMIHGALDGRAIALYYYSDDGGATWAESADWLAIPVKSTTGLQEPGIIQRRDGSIFGWMRTSTGEQWQTESTDDGVTWSLPTPSEFKSPGSPLSMKRVQDTGELLVIWNDTTRRKGEPAGTSWGRTPLVLALSADDGQTWDRHLVIEDKLDHGYCYCAIHMMDDAVLLAYLCGGGGTSSVLQDCVIRRISYTELGLR